MKKILITGGAGFIASHLADILIKQKGYKITAIDNLWLGKIENIAHLKNNPNFTFIKLDLLNKKSVEKLFIKNKFDVVYHLAANSDISRGSKDRTIDFNLNLVTTISVLEAMVKSGTKKIVFSSTGAIYGDLGKPMKEDSGPLFPVNFYGAGKLSAEAYIASYSSVFDLQVWICRFPNIIGERSTHGVMFDFINRLRRNPNELTVLGDGNQYKPYMYVAELVKNIYEFTKKTNSRINVINFGVSDGMFVRDIAKMVIKKLKLNSKIVYTGGSSGWKGDVPKYSYDYSYMKSLGFKSMKSKEAVEKAIDNSLAREKNSKK